MQMAERRKKRCHNNAGTSSAQPETILARDRWPKREQDCIETFQNYAVPRTGVRSKNCTHRQGREAWDDYDSLFYNAWEDVVI